MQSHGLAPSVANLFQAHGGSAQPVHHPPQQFSNESHHLTQFHGHPGQHQPGPPPFNGYAPPHPGIHTHPMGAPLPVGPFAFNQPHPHPHQPPMNTGPIPPHILQQLAQPPPHQFVQGPPPPFHGAPNTMTQGHPVFASPAQNLYPSPHAHPHHGQGSYPPAPPPSRQISALELPPQVSGPGSLLGVSPQTEEVAPVVGVSLTPNSSIDLDPAAKQLGGDDHAATPCLEYSSIPRGTDEEPLGRWIDHHEEFTAFALKQGLARLVYQPSGSDDKSMEVLKGHTSAVGEITFFAKGTNASQLALTVSSQEQLLWQFDVTDGRCTSKLLQTIKTYGFIRSRAHPTQSMLAQLSEAGEPSVLRVVNGVATTEQVHVRGVFQDVAWFGEDLLLVDKNGALVTAPLGDSDQSAIIASSDIENADRVIHVNGYHDGPYILLASEQYRKLSLWSMQARSIVATVTLPLPSVRYTGVEIDPSGHFAVVAYRRTETTGEVSDQGFIVFEIGRNSMTGTRAFLFATVFFQPSPILSFSVAAAPSATAGSPDLEIYAVEQKPIVRLSIAAASVCRSLPIEEVPFTGTITYGAPTSAASSPSPSPALPHGHRTGLGSAAEHAQQLAESTSSGIAQGAGSIEGVDEEMEDGHEHEAHDAVPALRSSLPKLLVSQEVHSGDTSPPSPAAGVLFGTSNPSSASSSAPSSRMQSPGVFKGERPEFQALDDAAPDEYNSGRSSPATSSPAKPMQLRPRGNSTDSRVSFNLGASAPSSQPTPATTPAPGTPNMYGLRTGTAPSSEVSSPLPSPLPSPRGPLSHSQLSAPPSPFPTHQNSVATTAAGSAAESPLISSPSSPLISPSPTPNMDDSSVGGIHSIPNTPLHAASSSVTPAPTPMSLTGGAVRLSQLSTADVSLHFLSATGDPSRLPSGNGAPTNTPMNTPANSVPSTPRLIGAAGRKPTAPANTPQSQALRVRTQSGSTSPSPISSPLLHPHTGYIKHRSASMDRSDGHGRLSSIQPDTLAEEDEPTGRSTRDQLPSRPSSATGLIGSAITSAKEQHQHTLLLKLDQLFSRHMGKLSGLMTQERMETAAAERARFESLTQDLVQAVSDRIESQLRDALGPAVETSLSDAMHDTILPSLDAAVRAGVSSSSASDPSVLSAAILQNLRTPLQESFRTAFTQTLIPSFEKSVVAMLSQVRQSMTAAATSSPLVATPIDEDAVREAKRLREEEEKRRVFAEQQAKQQQAEMKRLSTQMDQVLSLLASMGAAQQQSTLQIQELAKAQAALAARPVAAAPTAAAATPATPNTVDVNSEVTKLIAMEQFDAAFTKALSSGKLSSVLFACGQVDPRVLLSTSVAAHRLSAPVILSLIQQLAFDLNPSDSKHLQLKLLWLREASMVINVNDPILKAHIVPVLRDLLTKLDQGPIAALPPTSEHFDNVRMIRLLVQTKLASA